MTVTPTADNLVARHLGERNGRAKLTEAAVRDIRLRVIVLDEPCSSVARDYGVTAGAVALVARRRRWAHVVDEPPRRRELDDLDNVRAPTIGTDDTPTAGSS